MKKIAVWANNGTLPDRSANDSGRWAEDRANHGWQGCDWPGAKKQSTAIGETQEQNTRLSGVRLLFLVRVLQNKHNEPLRRI